MGAYVRNDPSTVILRAVAIMLGCYVVGLVVGGIAQRVIDDHAQAYEKNHPVPETVEDIAPPEPPPTSAAA